MPYFIAVETATPVCSVALMKDNEVIGIKESTKKNSHSEVVTLFVQDLLDEHNMKASDLDAIAVSKGPGSYTGLRIGVSTAKGLCYAVSKPLISVNTLHSMAEGMIKRHSDHNPEDFLFCPMIDARRMEVYASIYDGQGELIRETKAEIIDEQSYLEFLNDKQMIFFGDGADKCKEVITHPNALFVPEFSPSAAFMADVVLAKFNSTNFEDTAYFEPFYLKDFIAGVPKVKGLK